MKVTPEELIAGFREVGIRRGDLVYVASSLAALGLMDDPAGETLHALREAVGPRGTIVMPTFNFGFCSGEPFDREQTPATTGVLAEAFRVLPEARRTWSPPFHTVSAIGELAGEITAIESTTSFGRGSVFQRLHDMGAKHLLIGCGFHAGVAHFHWLEERFEVPYRFWKKFVGRVVLNGDAQECESFMYARRPGVKLDAEPLGQEFEAAGFVRRRDVGLCRLRAFDLKDFGRFFMPRFAEDSLCLLSEEQRTAYEPRDCPINRIDHIAVVSRYADKIQDLLEHLSYRLTHEAIVPALGVNVRIFDGLGVKIEIVNPDREDSVVSRYLERYPGCPLHHIAFEVDDLDEGTAYLRSRGYEPLDGRVISGAEPGQKVMFFSPILTGGLLIELVTSVAEGDCPLPPGDRVMPQRGHSRFAKTSAREKGTVPLCVENG